MEECVANCVILILICEVSCYAWHWNVWYAKTELQTPIQDCLSSRIDFSAKGSWRETFIQAPFCAGCLFSSVHILAPAFCSMLCLSCCIRYCRSVCKVLSISDVLISRRLSEWQKATPSYIMFVRLSLLSHGKTGLQLYGFSWNLIFRLFFF